MKSRCNYVSDGNYKNYGAKGVIVCSEWSESFDVFRDWAYANGYKEHLTIERKDVFGNYEPNNCCWITAAEQQRNKRNTRKEVREWK